MNFALVKIERFPAYTAPRRRRRSAAGIWSPSPVEQKAQGVALCYAKLHLRRRHGVAFHKAASPQGYKASKPRLASPRAMATPWRAILITDKDLYFIGHKPFDSEKWNELRPREGDAWVLPDSQAVRMDLLSDYRSLLQRGGYKYMEEELSDSFGFGDKRKVSPHEAPDKENAKRPAITGLLDASLASRFLSDPLITDMCDELAKDELVVKMARQLLEALQASTVLEDGTFNDSAFEHFALVMRIWRNLYFNAKINLVLVKNCIVPDMIDKLSNEVGNEQIGECMCRIKADHNLSDILQLKRPPATMIRSSNYVLLCGCVRYS
ncbi:Unknown protein [Striga hermonthica]|uniref:Uncharacterized protein n=1 Tax=Striga hermonthica TaxID=68872 RepID=A0A9N7NEE0_STRHE|nr:Unknown protein [Striga hermonthica]